MADSSIENVVTDLFGYLSPDSREDVKFFALNYVLGLTGSEEGMKFIKERPKLLERVVNLTVNDNSPDVKKNAYAFLLNASASPLVAEKLQEFNLHEQILPQLLDRNCKYADNLVMLLSNLTRMEDASQTCFKSIEKSKYSLEQIFDVFCMDKYNKHADLHYLAAFLSNLSRLHAVRMILLDAKTHLIQRLLPYVNFQDSVVRRKGIVRILRNCCFEYDFHDWLLGEDVDILPSLLLPLAGPDEFSETESDKLPLDLQYLEDTKQREPDAEIRKMLVEAITLLCSKTFGRQYIKEKNTYIIIRELHQWEKEEDVAIENLVQILIGDEPAPGMANLHEIEIPNDLKKQFEQCDEEKCS